MRRRSLAATFVAVLLVALRARADTPPSVWDRAADPGAGDRYALHVRIEHLLDPPEPEDLTAIDLRRDGELRLEAALAILEAADAADSPDVRLRFDLGNVYEEIATLENRTDLYQKAVDVLAPALERSPDHPAAAQAFESLVYAYAKLDRPRDELATWRLLIPRIDDDRARIAPLMNMGEAEMRLGRLDDALETFHEGLRLCESLPTSGSVNSTYALTLWDLAIALDRSGDPGGAIAAAAKAKAWSWSQVVAFGGAPVAQNVTGWDVIQDETNVFFVPDWDRQWYLALGLVAGAQQASSPGEAADLWKKAEDHWATYVARSSASGGHDRWLPIARARLARAHASRVEAEKRAPKKAARPPSGSWNDE